MNQVRRSAAGGIPPFISDRITPGRRICSVYPDQGPRSGHDYVEPVGGRSMHCSSMSPASVRGGLTKEAALITENGSYGAGGRALDGRPSPNRCL